MSHDVKDPWIERNWQVFLIAFAIVFVLTLALYDPGFARPFGTN